MNCSECKDLYRIFERTLIHYEEARSAAFYQVSTRIAVRKHIALERAKSDLREHQQACPWAIIAQRFGGSMALCSSQEHKILDNAI